MSWHGAEICLSVKSILRAGARLMVVSIGFTLLQAGTASALPSGATARLGGDAGYGRIEMPLVRSGYCPDDGRPCPDDVPPRYAEAPANGPDWRPDRHVYPPQDGPDGCPPERYERHAYAGAPGEPAPPPPPGYGGPPWEEWCGVRCWYRRLRAGYCGRGCDYYRFRMYEFPEGKLGRYGGRRVVCRTDR